VAWLIGVRSVRTAAHKKSKVPRHVARSETSLRINMNHQRTFVEMLHFVQHDIDFLGATSKNIVMLSAAKHLTVFP
jgi:hypothetical protein